MKLITKSVSAVILAVACLQPAAWAQNPTLEGRISVKSPGNPAVTFSRLDAGETHEIVWEIRKGKAVSWSDFVAGVWEYSFDRLHPQPMPGPFSTAIWNTASLQEDFSGREYTSTAIRPGMKTEVSRESSVTPWK